MQCFPNSLRKSYKTFQKKFECSKVPKTWVDTHENQESLSISKNWSVNEKICLKNS